MTARTRHPSKRIFGASVMKLHPIPRSLYRRGWIGTILLAVFLFLPTMPDAEEFSACSSENDFAAAYNTGNVQGQFDFLKKSAPAGIAP
jgi:hypothetical protein